MNLRHVTIALIAGLALPAGGVASAAIASANGASSVHASTSPASAAGDWAQPHYDATNSGFNPAETVLASATVGAVKSVWRLPTTTGGDTLGPGSPPITIGDRTYLLVSRTNKVNDLVTSLEAHDSGTGKRLFSDVITPGIAVCDPVYDSGRIFLLDPCTGGFEPTRLSAYSAVTGKKLWDVPGGPSTTDAAASGGRLFIATTQGSNPVVVARSESNGSILWKDLDPGGTWNLDAPVIVDGLAIESATSSTDGSQAVVALSTVTGKPVWTTHGVNLGVGPLSMASAGNHVLTTRKITPPYADAGMTALDTRTGKVLWTSSLASDLAGTAALGKSAVFSTCTGNKFCALSLITGAVLWSVPVPASCCQQMASVSAGVVANGVVYGTINTNPPTFHAWSTATGAIVTLPAALQTEQVVALAHGRLYTFALLPDGGANQLTVWAAPKP